MSTTQSPDIEISAAQGFLRPWRELSLIATVLMELSWVALWYQVLVRSSQDVAYLQVYFALVGMLLLVYFVNRITGYLGIRLLARRIILLLVISLNLFIGLKLLLFSREAISIVEILNRPLDTFGDMARLIPTEFVVMVFFMLVSWRGLYYLDYQIGSYNAISSFRLGVLMFFLYGMFIPLTRASPAIAFFLFLFFSLLAMSSARISGISQLRGGHSVQFNRQWMIGIVGIILVMIGIASVTLIFAQERLFNLLSSFLAWMIYILVLVFSPLLFGSLRFFMWLFSAVNLNQIFDFIFRAINNLQSIFASMMNAMSAWVERFNLDRIEQFFNMIASYKGIYLWLVLIILATFILLGVRRYIWKEKAEDDQEMQSQPVDEDLIKLLRTALRNRLGKLAEDLEEFFRLRQARRFLAAARIRRIYAMLLDLSARLDRPRPAARTPLEFLPELGVLFPSLTGELRTITEAYLLVRYGELPESPEDLDKVESAWKLVSSTGNEELKTRRRKTQAMKRG
jgi:hypothetical protein